MRLGENESATPGVKYQSEVIHGGGCIYKAVKK